MKYPKILAFLILISMVFQGILRYTYDQVIDIFNIIVIVISIMIITYKDPSQESKSLIANQQIQ